MNLKNVLRGFILYFALVLVVSAAVSFLYSLVAHGRGVVDWESAFRLALVFAIALPLVHEFEDKRK